jgi:hypothetical protein
MLRQSFFDYCLTNFTVKLDNQSTTELEGINQPPSLDSECLEEPSSPDSECTKDPIPPDSECTEEPSSPDSESTEEPSSNQYFYVGDNHILDLSFSLSLADFFFVAGLHFFIKIKYKIYTGIFK